MYLILTLIVKKLRQNRQLAGVHTASNRSGLAGAPGKQWESPSAPTTPAGRPLLPASSAGWPGFHETLRVFSPLLLGEFTSSRPIPQLLSIKSGSMSHIKKCKKVPSSIYLFTGRMTRDAPPGSQLCKHGIRHTHCGPTGVLGRRWNVCQRSRCVLPAPCLGRSGAELKRSLSGRFSLGATSTRAGLLIKRLHLHSVNPENLIRQDIQKKINHKRSH